MKVTLRKRAVPAVPIRPGHADELGRMSVLVASACAAARTALLEWLLEQEGDSVRESGDYEDARRRIEETRQKLENIAPHEFQNYADAYSQARAVTYSAVGRAAHLERKYLDAIKAYETAKAELQRLPEPHIGVAAAIFKMKARFDANWMQRIEDELNTALEINGASGKAYYYLGKLSLEREDFAKAEESFRKADPHPWTLYRLAQIVGNHKHEYAEALKILDQSILLLRRPDARYYSYAVWTLKLTKNNQANATNVSRAVRYAKELSEVKHEGRLRERAERLIPQLEAARGALKDPASAPPPPANQTGTTPG